MSTIEISEEQRRRRFGYGSFDKVAGEAPTSIEGSVTEGWTITFDCDLDEAKRAEILDWLSAADDQEHAEHCGRRSLEEKLLADLATLEQADETLGAIVAKKSAQVSPDDTKQLAREIRALAKITRRVVRRQLRDYREELE